MCASVTFGCSLLHPQKTEWVQETEIPNIKKMNLLKYYNYTSMRNQTAQSIVLIFSITALISLIAMYNMLIFWRFAWSRKMLSYCWVMNRLLPIWRHCGLLQCILCNNLVLQRKMPGYVRWWEQSSKRTIIRWLMTSWSLPVKQHGEMHHGASVEYSGLNWRCVCSWAICMSAVLFLPVVSLLLLLLLYLVSTVWLLLLNVLATAVAGRYKCCYGCNCYGCDGEVIKE